LRIRERGEATEIVGATIGAPAVTNKSAPRWQWLSIAPSYRTIPALFDPYGVARILRA